LEDIVRTGGGKLAAYDLGRSDNRTTADLVRDIISDVQEMVRYEVKLAKAEFREETKIAEPSAPATDVSLLADNWRPTTGNLVFSSHSSEVTIQEHAHQPRSRNLCKIETRDMTSR
jgi:hypothetical protein